MTLPLSGLTVVDLTTAVFGPYATQILGDLGADVLKIETPNGDGTRHTGPNSSRQMAAYFLAMNRNKKSIALDLHKPTAKDILWRLIEKADVFIHNTRPAKLKHKGFDHHSVMERNPRIIYAALYGYGRSGRYFDKPAYDDIIQAQAAIPDLMQRAGHESSYVPFVVADKTCALTAAYAVLAALLQRERTGEGQLVEVPMFETMASYMLVEHLAGATFDCRSDDIGYRRVLSNVRKPFRTKDGWIAVMPYTDAQWAELWSATNKPDLVNDQRFKTFDERTKNTDHLYDLLGQLLTTKPTSYWLTLFEKLAIPAASLNTLEEIMHDPHLKDVGLFRTIDHPTEGRITLLSQPVEINEGRSEYRYSPPPRLGADTLRILRSCGYDQKDIDLMIKEGAVYASTDQ